MSMWTNFAKNRKPGLDWPLFTNTDKKYQDIGLNVTTRKLYLDKRMAFWNDLVPLLDDKKACPKCNNRKTGSADKIQISFFWVIIVFVFNTLENFV